MLPVILGFSLVLIGITTALILPKPKRKPVYVKTKENRTKVNK